MLLWTLECMYIFELIFGVFRFMSRSGVLGPMAVLFLVFLETSILFSTMAVLIYVPTNDPNGVWAEVCILYNDDLSDWCEVIAHCGFDLHFPDDRQCWASFFVSVGHLHFIFRKMSFPFFCLFFFLILFMMSCVSCVYLLGVLTPYQSYHMWILCPIQ